MVLFSSDAELTDFRARLTAYANGVPVGKKTISAISEGVRGYTLDPKGAEALWQKSEELVGESF